MISGISPDGARQRPDLPGSAQAVQVRHLHVQHGHVERLASAQPRQRLEGRLGVLRHHVPRLKLKRQDAAVGGVVVDDQDALALQEWLTVVQVGAGRSRARSLRES